MSTPEFQGFLERLKKEAKPNEFALVEMSYVKDATICHGFGAPCMPVAEYKQVIGILRNKDAIAPRAVQNELVSPTESIFDVCLVEDDRSGKWTKPVDCHDYSMLQESHFALSPKAKLEVSRVENKTALDTKILTKSLEFWEELHNKTEFRVTMSDLMRGDRGISYDAFKSISEKSEMTVYLGQEAIIGYLIAKKEPLNLINALHQLNPLIPIPAELNDKAAVKAKEKATSFHKAAEIVFKKEIQFARESLLSWAASGEGRGVIIERESAVPAIERSKDYTKLMSNWQVGALKDDFSKLNSKVKEMKELNVQSFITTLRPRPWAEVNLQVLFEYVEKSAEKYETRFNEFKEKTKQKNT
ncbi:MAG: hypothetical protein ABSD68_04090 [Candidatus Micrarchaeales archaeon]|jgi:hypothetical protein